MENYNPFENIPTDFLADVNPVMKEINELLSTHKQLILHAAAAPAQMAEELMLGYAALITTFEELFTMGEMMAEAELVTRDGVDLT